MDWIIGVFAGCLLLLLLRWNRARLNNESKDDNDLPEHEGRHKSAVNEPRQWSKGEKNALKRKYNSQYQVWLWRHLDRYFLTFILKKVSACLPAVWITLEKFNKRKSMFAREDLLDCWSRLVSVSGCTAYNKAPASTKRQTPPHRILA